MKAVDHFMRTNKRIYNTDNYYDLSSLYSALDADEYDILYGIDDNEFYNRQRSVIRNVAYQQMSGNKLTIIYECPCKTTKKDNHHYNYNRPLEVMRLCRPCHLKEHNRLKLSEAPASAHSTTPAVNAPAEDRGDLSSQLHETATSYRESMPCMDDDRRAVAVTAELESREYFSISLPRNGRTDTAAIAINR